MKAQEAGLAGGTGVRGTQRTTCGDGHAGQRRVPACSGVKHPGVPIPGALRGGGEGCRPHLPGVPLVVRGAVRRRAGHRPWGGGGAPVGAPLLWNSRRALWPRKLAAWGQGARRYLGPKTALSYPSVPAPTRRLSRPWTRRSLMPPRGRSAGAGPGPRRTRPEPGTREAHAPTAGASPRREPAAHAGARAGERPLEASERETRCEATGPRAGRRAPRATRSPGVVRGRCPRPGGGASRAEQGRPGAKGVGRFNCG